MVLILVVVRAAVVVVDADAAALELPLDPFAGDECSTMLAREEAAGQRHVDLRFCPTVLPAEDILTGLERRPVDQRSMSPLVEVAAAFDFTDIEPVVEHVRDSCAMELRVRLQPAAQRDIQRAVAPQDQPLADQLVMSDFDLVIIARMRDEDPATCNEIRYGGTVIFDPIAIDRDVAFPITPPVRTPPDRPHGRKKIRSWTVRQTDITSFLVG